MTTKPITAQSTPRIPDAGLITAYENGELDAAEIIDLFQDLLDSGAIYELQGSYGRMAQSLIENGYCTID